MPYEIVDDLQEYIDSLSELPKAERESLLFLEEDDTLPKHWAVECLDESFVRDFEGVLKRRVVHPFSFDKFSNRAHEMGYNLVWLDDPTNVFNWASSLYDEPDVEINSTLPGTTKGFLPFQIQGYNFLKNSRAGVANWSTGTGKTVLAAALTRHYVERKKADLVVWVVKAHNKINTQRAIKKLTDLDSTIIDGTPKQREVIYKQVISASRPSNKGTPIVIVNYEKFRDDERFMTKLFAKTRVYVVWDEMPTKLRNRGTQLYRATARVLYTCATDKRANVDAKRLRSKSLSQLMLSATPIENNPMDFFNCERLLTGGTTYGTITQFNQMYVRSWSPWNMSVPKDFKNVTLMGQKAVEITHQVDKKDPDIASQFPSVLDDIVSVEMGPAQQKLYDRLMVQFLDEERENDFNEENILAKIGVAQMICNHPLMALNSAMAYDDPNSGYGSAIAYRLLQTVGEKVFKAAGAAKLEPLQEKLEGVEDEKNGKAVIFSVYNAALLPILSKQLHDWNLDHVVYHGSLTGKKKQEAEDRFRDDKSCRVFLSSDSGSDSINLENANITIHYDIPWLYSRKVQRLNRMNRITSKFETQWDWTLYINGTVESRRMELQEIRREWDEAVFKGAVADISGGARSNTKKDLLYILFGQ